jgi:hypothetical protein
VHVYHLCERSAASLDPLKEFAYFCIFRRVKADVVTILAHRVIFSEERAKDCTLGGYIGGRCCFHVRDFVHEPGTSLH